MIDNKNNYPGQRQAAFFFRALALCLVVASCAPVPPRPIGWSPSWLLGSSLTLVSDERVESFCFSNSEYVAATLGQRGGPLTAPMLRWRVVNGKLGLGENDSYELLEFVASSGSRVMVRRRDGSEAQYELEHL